MYVCIYIYIYIYWSSSYFYDALESVYQKLMAISSYVGYTVYDIHMHSNFTEMTSLFMIIAACFDGLKRRKVYLIKK